MEDWDLDMSGGRSGSNYSQVSHTNTLMTSFICLAVGLAHLFWIGLQKDFI